VKIFRLARIQEAWAPHPHLFLFPKHRPPKHLLPHCSLITRYFSSSPSFQFSASAFRISAFTSMFFLIDIILNENPVPIRDRLPGLEKTASLSRKA
jgi:hypothetical protein